MKCIAIGVLLVTVGFTQTDPVIEVKPGPQVIKDKDIYDNTGIVHPFRRMPRYILADQKAIWTSPFHTAKSDIKWWAIFGGATAVAIATDHWTSTHLPNSSSQISVSTWASRAGSAYVLIPVSAGFYFIGTAKHDDRFRETGLIAFETLIDATIVGEAIKLVGDRARPTESNGRGHFFDSPNARWDSSFPSGHAMSAWAMASVIAHEYPKPIVYVVVYGLATTVVAARVGARRHFPGDVIAGGAAGWFIGDYVYGRRHNRALDKKAPIVRRILDHVQIGATIE
ncbi:MAG: phosphatase PAP2 family protein [Candidatus Solibacter sp.]